MAAFERRMSSVPAVEQHRRMGIGRSYGIRKDASSVCRLSSRARKGGYEDWTYLRMLEREWFRPLSQADRFGAISGKDGPSPRAIMVIVFWSYFETRIVRLFREAAALPEQVVAYLLERQASVGARLDRLYRVVFSTTYWADLNNLGYGSVATLLRKVQGCRNDFAHGQPEAIDDSLVEELVTCLKDEHEAWIAVFNRRLAANR